MLTSQLKSESDSPVASAAVTATWVAISMPLFGVWLGTQSLVNLYFFSTFVGMVFFTFAWKFSGIRGFLFCSGWCLALLSIPMVVPGLLTTMAS